LMTMEMWWLGFYMDRFRLALLMLAMVPLLIALDHYVGFKEEQTTWREDVGDGMIAYGVGIVSSCGVLLLFNVLNLDMPLQEWVGKVSLQAVPASFGAVLATSQLGGEKADEEQRVSEEAPEGGYWAELLFMLTGAVFLAFNVAPTEEIALIAFQINAWYALGIAITSLGLMHAIVYAVEFFGSPGLPENIPVWSVFIRYTVTGYAIALFVSAYVLWTFGRFDGDPLIVNTMQTIVLAFPAALGAAGARLIL
ncbi:MAG TPA: TIGR02587 family membrane protein, partial [Longimicrobiales bacterium]|nr:TIGR02587 family membrane protein [Longimicrobiales bacterium]